MKNLRSNYLNKVAPTFRTEKNALKKERNRDLFWSMVGQAIPWYIVGYFIGSVLSTYLIYRYIVFPFWWGIIEVIIGE